MPTPRGATLPDSLSFLAKYKRVPRGSLLPNVTVRRRYKQRVAPKNRRRERGRGFFDFDFVKNVAKYPAVKALWRAALKRVSTLLLDHTSKKKETRQ